MGINYLLNGLVVGITVSLPLGPMGILCIQRTMNKGVKSGIVSGLGIAVGDTLYAIIAGFGISFIMDFLDAQHLIIRFIGGLFLIYLGYKIFVTNPGKELRKQRRKRYNPISDFFSVFFLTLSNPITIIFFGGVFAGFGLVEKDASVYHTIMLVVGVFFGAMLWWGLLALIVNIFRHKIRLRNLWWINKITGVVIMLLGIFVSISVFFLDIDKQTQKHLPPQSENSNFGSQKE